MCFKCTADSKNYAIYMIATTIVSVRLIEYATIKTTNKIGFDFILRFLSRYTYEIYLVQYPVIYFAQRFLVENNFYLAIIIGTTIIISYITYILLGIRSKNKLFNLRRKSDY